MARFLEVTDYADSRPEHDKVFIDLDSVVRVQFSKSTAGVDYAMVVLSSIASQNTVKVRDPEDLAAIRSYLDSNRHS
jgi:hypothetical protein